MSFGGHVQAMNNRMKQNRAQRPSKRAKFKENNREGIYADYKDPALLNFKKLSESEIREMKIRVQKATKLEQRREKIIYGISIIIVILILTGLLYWFN